jgi:hypothetical protein
MGFTRPTNEPGYPNYPPPPGTGPQEPEIVLRQISPARFQLLHPFCYEREGSDEVYRVPAHDPHASPTDANSTDLASVPPLLTWFIGTYGIHTRAALFHDHYVDAPPPMTRKQADTLFRDALRESGVRWLRRWLMWTAVSLRTSFGALGLVVIVIHLLELAVATGWWLLDSLPWGFPIAIAAAGFVWGLHRWPLAVLGFTLVAPPAGLAFVARLVAWITELVEEVVVYAYARRRPLERPLLNPSAKKRF